MKQLMLTLSVLACSIALLSSPVFAQEKVKEKGAKACGCCPASVEAGKKCEKCECCKKAAEKNKVCAKCHPQAGKKDEKKEKKEK